MALVYGAQAREVFMTMTLKYSALLDIRNKVASDDLKVLVIVGRYLFLD